MPTKTTMLLMLLAAPLVSVQALPPLAAWDEDGDAALDFGEWEAGVLASGVWAVLDEEENRVVEAGATGLTEREASYFLDTWDYDMDGRLSEIEGREIFVNYDQNGDGLIAAPEYRALMEDLRVL